MDTRLTPAHSEPELGYTIQMYKDIFKSRSRKLKRFNASTDLNNKNNYNNNYNNNNNCAYLATDNTKSSPHLDNYVIRDNICRKLSSATNNIDRSLPDRKKLSQSEKSIPVAVMNRANTDSQSPLKCNKVIELPGTPSAPTTCIKVICSSGKKSKRRTKSLRVKILKKNYIRSTTKQRLSLWNTEETDPKEIAAKRECVLSQTACFVSVQDQTLMEFNQTPCRTSTFNKFRSFCRKLKAGHSRSNFQTLAVL